MEKNIPLHNSGAFLMRCKKKGKVRLQTIVGIYTEAYDVLDNTNQGNT